MTNQRRGRSMRSILLLLAAGAWLGLTAVARGQDANETRARQAWDSLTDKDKNAEAEQYARQAIRLADARRDTDSVIYWQDRIGCSLLYQKKYAEAEAAFKLCLDWCVKVYGPDSADTAVCYYDLGRVDKDRGRYASAEGFFKKAVEIRDRLSQTNDFQYRDSLEWVVELDVMYLGRYAAAIPLATRLLALNEAANGPESDQVSTASTYLGLAYSNLGRNADSEASFRRALAIYTKRRGPEHDYTLTAIFRLGGVVAAQGRYDQAETLFRQALAGREKVNGPESAVVADCLTQLSGIKFKQQYYRDCEVLARKAVAVAEKAYGPENLTLATALNNLGLSCLYQMKLAAAEKPLRQALAIFEKAKGTDERIMALCMDNLGLLYVQQARHAEAEPLLKRTLALVEKLNGPDSEEVAHETWQLGSLYTKLGRFSEAEPHLRRAVQIRRKDPATSPSNLAVALGTLAMWAQDQRRNDEARALYRESIALMEKIKPEPSMLSFCRTHLAALDPSKTKPEELLASLRQAVSDAEKASGPSHASVAYELNQLAQALFGRGEFAEAAEHYRRCLKIDQMVYGASHLEVATALKNVADCDIRLGKLDEGEPMAERAVDLLDHLGASPQLRAEAYHIRAQYAWKVKRRSEALADLEKALDLVETARVQASGTGVEKAAFFGGFDYMYEQMVAYQAEQDDASGVLRTIERSHARSLLEEFSVAGTDLDAGRSVEERERLAARERELSAAIAGLEKRIADGSNDPNLAGELAAARDRLYDHYRESRTSSAVYQGLVTSSGGPVRLSTLQRKSLAKSGAMVVYHVGEHRSFAVVATEFDSRIIKMEIDEATARVLGVEPGELSAAMLQRALINAEGTGVVQMLSDRVKSKEATPKLAALWKLLVPEVLKKSLLAGQVVRLIIVPDGPLALLPFEALVVQPGEEPKYFLDICPPITYSPSASVLANLEGRPAKGVGREPVLTVGDPAYSGGEPALAVAANESKTRFGAGGGRLSRLPFTAREVDWVVKGLEENKMKATPLLGAKATEAAVRAAVAGRTWVHLACHGLSDPAHGNFYGALALTPGPKAATNPEDDGFLTLTEIYRLNLSSCEVAVLSACNTNFGPQQKGEGTWAVSRGFLVAGARRVVASNWLVDDESAASLISLFLTESTKPRPVQPPANPPKGPVQKFTRALPATCLLKAKRWVRQQEAWKSPYYWASFVQIGPP